MFIKYYGKVVDSMDWMIECIWINIKFWMSKIDKISFLLYESIFV